MNELIPIVLIALISLAIGFLLGLMVSGLRAEKGNSRALEAVDQAQESPGGQQRIAAQPLARTFTNPAPLLTRTPQPNKQSKPASARSIAAQIDEILQHKLASGALDYMPAERRAIRLIELPGKGMVVMVGMDRYEGVEKVPDPEIRSLIREAVEEWEKSLAAG